MAQCDAYGVDQPLCSIKNTHLPTTEQYDQEDYNDVITIRVQVPESKSTHSKMPPSACAKNPKIKTVQKKFKAIEFPNECRCSHLLNKKKECKSEKYYRQVAKENCKGES